MCVRGGVATDQALIGVRNQKAHKRQGDNIEERDAPEDLFYSGRERFSRVSRLGGGKADKFGPDEGESSGDEDAAKTLETVVEGARVAPVLPTDIASVRASSAVKNDSKNAEILSEPRERA